MAQRSALFACGAYQRWSAPFYFTRL